MSIHKAHAGYTLVEIMITLTVLSIVSLVVMNFEVDSIGNYTAASAKADLLSESQRALDIANTDIRLSAAADDNNRWQDANAPSSPGDNFSWASNASTLVLATAVENNAGDIVFADASKYISEKNNIVYFVKNGNLYRRTIASPALGNSEVTTCPAASATPTCPKDKLLLSNVTSFTVQYINGNGALVSPDDAKAVELSVTVKSRKYGRNLSVSYTTRTVFRNE